MLALLLLESISTDGYPNHKPSYGFIVDPQFPGRRGNNHEVTNRNGENGMGFESSRPSGIPYFGQLTFIIAHYQTL